MEFIFKILKHFAFIKKCTQELLITIIKFPTSRKIVNSFYNNLNYKEKKQFHSLFADMFRNKKTGADGLWHINFLKTKIDMSLSKDRSWLEWETALSILGHDIEVKETYEYLIKKGQVKCFLDIGANYGTHSLLFLSQNIKTITFEPNTACHNYFHEILKTNNLSGQLESFALGDKETIAELVFPERETWLGKIQITREVLTDISLNQHVIGVRIISLDSYIDKKGLNPDLIKIDTEGFEKFVINGAMSTLKKNKPMIIFECNSNERESMFEVFTEIDYGIYMLPFKNSKHNSITKVSFIESRLNNFLAIYKDHPILEN